MNFIIIYYSVFIDIFLITEIEFYKININVTNSIYLKEEKIPNKTL